MYLTMSYFVFMKAVVSQLIQGDKTSHASRMNLKLILSHNSVSEHFCKQHGNLYMTAKSIFENSNLLKNAFLIWHRTH